MTGGLLQMSGVVVDLVHPVDHLPCPGEEVEARGILISAGGGFNAMAAARRSGIDVTYGGSIGTGLFADIAYSMMTAEGITVAAQGRRAIDQGTCVVLVDGSGERSFISHHGAERQIDSRELDALGVSGFAWILLTGYSLFKEESARAFVPWLRTLPRGPRFLFDPGPVIAKVTETHLSAALLRADWISANRSEAKVLTGSDEPAQAAQVLSKGREGALVRSGAEGCWLALSGGPARHVAGFAVDAVDTNGAGDTHDGAFIAACCHGLVPHDAAIFANAAAALSTASRGPATAPGFGEVQAFLKVHASRA